MYDKYNKIDILTPSEAKLPAHKGIMISSTAAAGITVYCYAAAGGTMSVTLRNAVAGTNIYPFQIYSMPAIAAGSTAWILN